MSTHSTMTGIIRDFDFESLGQQFQNNHPFPSICIDNFLEEEFARDVAEAYPSYEEAKSLGRGFDAVNEKGKYQITHSESFPAPIRQLHETLASEEFLKKMETLSGITGLVADEELVGGGIHQTGPRGHLDVHVDFNYITERRLHRRMNILVFFNREWEDAWGGKLELWDENVQTCHHTFAPIFNRCCIFQTSEISYHGVTAVKCPESIARKSFAAYYYTPETNDNFMENVHSTIFKARPDEKLKKNVLMPFEKLKRGLNRTTQRVKRLFKK